MDELQTLSALVLVLAGLSWVVPRAGQRLNLPRHWHRLPTEPPPIVERVASPIPVGACDENRFFDSDGAPQDVVRRRRTGFSRLASLYAQRFESSAAITGQTRTDPSEQPAPADLSGERGVLWPQPTLVNYLALRSGRTGNSTKSPVRRAAVALMASSTSSRWSMLAFQMPM